MRPSKAPKASLTEELRPGDFMYQPMEQLKKDVEKLKRTRGIEAHRVCIEGLLTRLEYAQHDVDHSNHAMRKVQENAKQFNSEGSLTLYALQQAGYDIHGSADLHFDGDCFQEHEWKCRARSGVFGHDHSACGSGVTALDAILEVLEKKYKAAAGPCKNPRASKATRKHKKDYLEHFRRTLDHIKQQQKDLRKKAAEDKRKEQAEMEKAPI
jgi:hypothetical protein